MANDIGKKGDTHSDNSCSHIADNNYMNLDNDNESEKRDLDLEIAERIIESACQKEYSNMANDAETIGDTNGENSCIKEYINL
eukprot:Awhi_evm1s5582